LLSIVHVDVFLATAVDAVVEVHEGGFRDVLPTDSTQGSTRIPLPSTDRTRLRRRESKLHVHFRRKR
jgi:hypothetical protein